MEKSKLLINRLAIIAEVLGLNANQIGKATGISRSQIPKIFKHESEPSLSKYCTLEAFILEQYKVCDVKLKSDISKRLRAEGIDPDIMQPLVFISVDDKPKKTNFEKAIAETAATIDDADVTQSLQCGCKMDGEIFKRGKGCIKKKSDHYFLNL